MKEKDLVGAILRMLRKTPGCFCWKEHGGMYGTAGIPDIILCYKGRFAAMEVKTETGRVSKLQEITIQRIQAAGGAACVVRSVREAEEMLKRMEVDADDE